jgi:hypothetical protein
MLEKFPNVMLFPGGTKTLFTLKEIRGSSEVYNKNKLN